MPKVNVGYTGNRRLGEEDHRRSNSYGKGEIQASPLIGMPKLKQSDPQNSHHSVQRETPSMLQQYNSYQAPSRNTMGVASGGGTSSYNIPLRTDKKVPSLQLSSALTKGDTNEGTYPDMLDKFMTERSSGLKKLQFADQLQSMDIGQPSRRENSQHQPQQLFSGGYLSSRNNEVAKSTANLIINPQQQISKPVENEKPIIKKESDQKQKLYDSLSDGGNNSPKNNSPSQVQKKIQMVQSQINAQTAAENHESYLNKISQANEMGKTHKKTDIFNVNMSTVPSNGRYQIRQSEGPIKRSLNLAPSTFLGQHLNEEVDENIQKREYTKLGGANLAVQMPSDLNNIRYHKSNPMKDYTYNNLTGAYYYKANC